MKQAVNTEQSAEPPLSEIPKKSFWSDVAPAPTTSSYSQTCAVAVTSPLPLP